MGIVSPLSGSDLPLASCLLARRVMHEARIKAVARLVAEVCGVTVADARCTEVPASVIPVPVQIIRAD